MTDNLLTIIGVVFTIIGVVFTMLNYCINKKNSKSKISFNIKIDDFRDYDKFQYTQYDEECISDLSEFEIKKIEKYKELEEILRFKQFLFKDELTSLYKADHISEKKGFPSIRHDKQVLSLDIVNNSDFPVKNISAQIILIVKRAVWETGIDEADIISDTVKYIKYKEIKKNIEIPYLGVNVNKKIYLANLEGFFIAADFYIQEAKSQKVTYIKERTILHEYEHKDFCGGLTDSNHFRNLLGANNKID